MKRYQRTEGDRRPVHAVQYHAEPGLIASLVSDFGPDQVLIGGVGHSLLDTAAKAVLVVLKPESPAAPPVVAFDGDWIIRDRKNRLDVIPAAVFTAVFKEFE